MSGWSPARLTCCLCDVQGYGQLSDLHRIGWTWFTGYMPARKACCPRCRQTRRDDLAEVIDASRVKPATRIVEAVE